MPSQRRGTEDGLAWVHTAQAAAALAEEVERAENTTRLQAAQQALAASQVAALVSDRLTPLLAELQQLLALQPRVHTYTIGLATLAIDLRPPTESWNDRGVVNAVVDALLRAEHKGQ